MKISPLPFSPLMARAWYADRKTQTRRIMVPQPEYAQPDGTIKKLAEVSPAARAIAIARLIKSCPYGGPGDRVWIKETLIPNPAGWISYKDDGALADDGRPVVWPWKVRKIVPRYMPRWACRSYGEIVEVRAEPVQDITEEDAIAEGVQVTPGHLSRPIGSTEPPTPYTHRQAYAALWDEINAERGYGWDANPWVWALTLRRLP